MSIAFHDLSSPHSDVLPSSEASEESFLLNKSIVLSFMDPVIQRDILNRIISNVKCDSFL